MAMLTVIIRLCKDLEKIVGPEISNTNESTTKIIPVTTEKNLIRTSDEVTGSAETKKYFSYDLHHLNWTHLEVTFQKTTTAEQIIIEEQTSQLNEIENSEQGGYNEAKQSEVKEYTETNNNQRNEYEQNKKAVDNQELIKGKKA